MIDVPVDLVVTGELDQLMGILVLKLAFKKFSHEQSEILFKFFPGTICNNHFRIPKNKTAFTIQQRQLFKISFHVI